MFTPPTPHRHPAIDETQDLSDPMPAVPKTAHQPGRLSPHARLETIASILAVAALRRRLKQGANDNPQAHLEDSSPAPRRRT